MHARFVDEGKQVNEKLLLYKEIAEGSEVEQIFGITGSCKPKTEISSSGKTA